MKPVLKIDWATYEAAKYAVENWHYSKVMVMPQSVKLGCWENGIFIGVIIFNRGACDKLGNAYGLKNTETCELVRVALKSHITPVSRIIKISLIFLRVKCPNLRLVISFADPNEGHHGGIYQAGGWIYSGKSNKGLLFFDKTGRRQHPRNMSEKGYVMQFGKKKKCIKPSECLKKIVDGKHRYLMPLDNEMRKQILPLAKAYPKRAGSDTSDTPAFQAGEGGSLPTPALHSQHSPNP
jgi:hypothetical protein